MARRKKNESQYAFGLAWFEQDDGSCIPQFAQTKTKDLAELEKFRAPLRGDSQDAVLPGTEEDISAVLLLQANIRQISNKSADFRSESLSNAKKAIMELRKRRSLVVPAAFPKTPGTKKTNRFRPVSKDGHVPTMSSLNDCSDEESSRMEIEESISENTRCEDTSVGSSKHNVSEDSSNKKVVKKTKNLPKKKPPTSNRPKRVTRASKQICSPYTEEKRPSKSRAARNNATTTRFTRASRQISSQHVQDAEVERPSKSISTNSKATRNNRASADEEAADVNSRGEERDETGSPKRAVGDTVSVDESVESTSSPVANRKSNNVERADAGHSLNEDTSHSEESAETNTGLVCDNNGKSLEQTDGTEGARDDMAVGSPEAASTNGEAGVPLPVRELITRHEAFIEQHHSDHCETSDDAVGSKHAGRSMADMVNSCMRKKPTIQLFKLKELSTPDRPITLTMEAFTSDDDDSDFIEKSKPAGPDKALQATPTGAIFQQSNNERSDDNLTMEEDSLADDKTETSTVCSSSAATILMEDVMDAMADADPRVRDVPRRSTRQRRSVLSARASKAKGDKTSDTDDSSETAATKRPKIVKPIRPLNSASRLRVTKPTPNVGRHKRAIDQVESSGFMSPGRPKKLIKCASPLCQQKAKRKAPQRKSRNTFLNRSTAASRSRRTPGTASPCVSRTRPGLFQFNPAVSMNRLTPSRPNNLPTGIQSFLKRHTPQKPKTFAEQQAEREEQLREKEAREKEAKKKKEEEKQKELQERKQKKEEKRLRAAAQRLQREEEKQRQKVKKIEQWEKKVENADNVKVLRKKEKEAEGKILKKKQLDTVETARKGEEERTKKIKEQEQEKEKRLEEQKQQKEQEAAEKAAEKALREEADRARKQAEKEQAEEDRKKKLKKAAEADRLRQARLEKEENERKKKEENEKKRKVQAEIDKKNAEAAAIEQETTEREKEALRKQEDESERRQEEAKQRKEREEARRKKQEKAKAEQEERTRRREEEEAKRTEELRKKKEAMRKEAEKRREEERMEEKRKREEEKQKREEENQAKIQAANEKLKLLKEEQQKQKQLLIEMGQTSPNLNGTYNVSSYDMTPHVPKQFAPSTEENYNIADISSGDSTDDDEQPRKTVPKWAKGGQLRNALIKQYYHVPKLSEIFVGLLGEPLDLADVFRGTKARYFKRTSSAVWNSPIRDIGHISFTEHCRPTNV